MKVGSKTSDHGVFISDSLTEVNSPLSFQTVHSGNSGLPGKAFVNYVKFLDPTNPLHISLVILLPGRQRFFRVPYGSTFGFFLCSYFISIHMHGHIGYVRE